MNERLKEIKEESLREGRGVIVHDENFAYLIQTIEQQQEEIEQLKKRQEELLIESGKRWTKLIRIKGILESDPYA